MATAHAKVSGWQENLTPHIIDRLARVTPKAIYALYPVTTKSYSEGYRAITYREFANVINGLAWWLETTLGHGGSLGTRQSVPVLAYIGPNDVRYTALVVAALKAGYVLFTPSPRNSLVAHGKLLGTLRCSHMLSSKPTPAGVSEIVAAHDLIHKWVPSVEALLQQSHKRYPYEKQYNQVQNEAMFIIHTSGSTGIPKPLIWSHATAQRNMNMLAADPPPGQRSVNRENQMKRVLNAFPPFHGAGLTSYLLNAVPFGTVMIAPIAEGIVTAEGLVEAMQKTKVDIGFFVPAIVRELSLKIDLLKECAKHLDLILYCGGDLPQDIGNKVALELPLSCQYGASEMGLLPQLISPSATRHDWQYVYLHPCLGTVYREVAEELFELVIPKMEDKSLTQPTFTIGPSLYFLDEYNTSDLFSPHPSIANLWRWRARSDDIIVFLNGEKTNPISMEQYIVAQNPEVNAALVLGSQRLQAALLVEIASSIPRSNPADEAVLVEKLWPSIQEANKVAPAHARIEKSFVHLVKTDKPMIRAGKGTVQRAASLKQYEKEIDEMYRAAETKTALDRSDFNTDLGNVAQFLEQTIKNVCGSNGNIDNEADLFELGLDSLQSLQIMRRIKERWNLPGFELLTIYNHPSIAKLADAISLLHKRTKKSQHTEDHEMLSILEDLRNSFPQAQSRTNTIGQPKPPCVLLVGSTGNLGPYLLDALLANNSVDSVYCLDRRPDASQWHQTLAPIPVMHRSNRVTFLHGDSSLENLGLEKATYMLLSEKLTLIIHNAWPVNFNTALRSFRPSLRGLVNLIRLSAQSPNRPRVFFNSSISSVLGSGSPTQQIEETISKALSPFPNGYAQSKYIAEHLCKLATENLRLPVSIARIGQIAGPSKLPGTWKTIEWMPSLLISSVKLNALPSSLGPDFDKVEWIPVDLLADITVELALDSDPKKLLQVYQLVNPHPAAWSELVPSIVSAIETLTGRSLELVSVSDWIDKVEASLDAALESNKKEDFQLNPAVKLLSFYRSSMLASERALGSFEQTQTLVSSRIMRQVPAIGPKWMHKWVVDCMRETQDVLVKSQTQ